MDSFDGTAVIEESKTSRIVVAHDHNVIGGFGSMVSMVLAQREITVKYKCVGIGNLFVAMAHVPYLYNVFGLNANGLAKAIKSIL